MVERYIAFGDFDSLETGLARRYARGLLGGGTEERHAAQAGRRCAAIFADVCEIQSGWFESRVRACEQHLCGGNSERAYHADHARRFGNDCEWNLRLGIRGRTRCPRWISLEPGWTTYRLLAI